MGLSNWIPALLYFIGMTKLKLRLCLLQTPVSLKIFTISRKLLLTLCTLEQYVMLHTNKYMPITLKKKIPWWHHQMETFSALLALCAGNSPVPGNFPHKGQWRGALMFYLICVWINGWVNNREAGDLRRHRGHYDVIVMHWKHACKTVTVAVESCRY